MSEVRSILDKVKKSEPAEEKVELDLEVLMRLNREKQEKLKAERQKQNKMVTRKYGLKH